MCTNAGFQPKVGFRSDDYNVVQGLIAAGVGISLLPGLALTNLREDIVVRSLGKGAPARKIAAATLEGRYRSPCHRGDARDPLRGGRPLRAARGRRDSRVARLRGRSALPRGRSAGPDAPRAPYFGHDRTRAAPRPRVPGDPAVLPAPAAADGLPAVGVGARPLSTFGGKLEYVTARAKPDTFLRERSVARGRVLRSLRLKGNLSGAGGGIRRLAERALGGWPHAGVDQPAQALPARQHHLRRDRREAAAARAAHIRLRGDFSFDAISPDGRLVYVIDYLSKSDFTKYAVRAYDMRGRGGCCSDPVVDPNEPGEDMSGLPIVACVRTPRAAGHTRSTSPAQAPVRARARHRARRTAVCIDLDDVRSLSALELHCTATGSTFSGDGVAWWPASTPPLTR